MSLNEREISVLSTIAEEYILNAAPVGSRTVSKKSRLGLGPASIRNIMADLTEKGYLEQPHTSAGRIPTTMGFRLYVDKVLNIKPLSPAQREIISSYLDDAGLDVSEVLKRASKLLSSLSKQVSMVLSPSQTSARWKSIDFILIRPGLVMAVLVFIEGIVQNKIITVSEDMISNDLEKYRNYLNEKFQGRTISEVRQHIVREMKEASETFDALYQRALQLARQTFDDDSRKMFVNGTINILNQPDFSDMETMRELFTILDERSRLLELLDKVTSGKGVKILFGQEPDMEALPYCGLISSPYGTRGEILGALGIIGPLRMNYAKVIPVVDFTAQMLSEVLKKRL